MGITIYKIDASPPARAVLMMVDILKLNVNTKEINTMAGEQHNPEYLQKNPLHKVPLLEEGDFILADSHAIITYLVSKYGAEKRATYYPSDLATRAIVDQRLYFDATILFPKIINIVVSVLKDGAAEPSPQQIADVNEAYGYAERYLEKSPFIAGEHITVADVSCVASVSSLTTLVPVGEEFPNLQKWLTTLEAQPWYVNANLPGVTQFSGLVKQRMAKNASE